MQDNHRLPPGKSWLAVDKRTNRLGMVANPAHRMGSAFFRDGIWRPVAEMPSGIQLSGVVIDELSVSSAL